MSLQRAVVTDFKSKFSSKRDVYQFLTLTCKIYLPPEKYTNIYFLKELISKKKKVS